LALPAALNAEPLLPTQIWKQSRRDWQQSDRPQIVPPPIEAVLPRSTFHHGVTSSGTSLQTPGVPPVLVKPSKTPSLPLEAGNRIGSKSVDWDEVQAWFWLLPQSLARLVRDTDLNRQHAKKSHAVQTSGKAHPIQYIARDATDEYKKRLNTKTNAFKTSGVLGGVHHLCPFSADFELQLKVDPSTMQIRIHWTPLSLFDRLMGFELWSTRAITKPSVSLVS
jgi:hypothetical protein